MPVLLGGRREKKERGGIWYSLTHSLSRMPGRLCKESALAETPQSTYFGYTYSVVGPHKHGPTN